jgi:hypothetical protein
MITGAVAAVIYGEPRFTRDLDVVVDLRPGDAHRVVSAFPGDRFYTPPPEVVEQEAARPLHGHFNLIHHGTALRADCYVAGIDPLHKWAITRRIRHDVRAVGVWVAPIEYVILRKLEWYRDGGASRHLDDIRAMLRVSGGNLDRAALDAWVTRLGLENEWKLIASGLLTD